MYSNFSDALRAVDDAHKNEIAGKNSYFIVDFFWFSYEFPTVINDDLGLQQLVGEQASQIESLRERYRK